MTTTCDKLCEIQSGTEQHYVNAEKVRYNLQINTAQINLYLEARI